MLGKDLKRQIVSPGMILAVAIGLVLLLQPSFETFKGMIKYNISISDDYISFYTNALGLGGFLVFTPLLVVLPGVIQFCDDYNTGYSRFIITRKNRKTYLFSRYLSSVISGGIACMLALVMLGIITIILCKPAGVNDSGTGTVIYSSFEKSGGGLVLIAHICFMGFIFGIVWSSVGMAVSAVIPNRYVALCMPLIIFYGAHIILSYLELYRFSPVNMIYLDIQKSLTFVLVYQAIILLITIAIFIAAGDRRLKDA